MVPEVLRSVEAMQRENFGNDVCLKKPSSCVCRHMALLLKYYPCSSTVSLSVLYVVALAWLQ